MTTSTNSNLVDRFGRGVRYLRVSVTDRCNFRCKYCVPEHQFKHLPHSSILRYEEILLAVQAFARLGVRKVRVTGGEPLVRKGIVSLLQQITATEGIEEVTLTTNGALLGEMAPAIFAAGVRRINVSLDSLRPERFAQITGGFSYDNTLSSILAAKEAGLSPIKANAVLIRGFNDDELHDFCAFSAQTGIVVRFIEFMPIGNSSGWTKENIITGAEILSRIAEKYGIEPVAKEHGAGPAQNYRLSNGGKIGIITPISNHFCSECDKLRLTADGKIRPCLLSDSEVDVSDAIRAGDLNALTARIIEGLHLKEKEHTIIAGERNDRFRRTMSKIGG